MSGLLPNPKNMVQQQFQHDAVSLRRDLRRVIREATIALVEMDRGIVPWSSSTTGPILRSSEDVEARQKRLDGLRTLIGSDILPLDYAMKVTSLNFNIKIPEEDR